VKNETIIKFVRYPTPKVPAIYRNGFLGLLRFGRSIFISLKKCLKQYERITVGMHIDPL
jgi:hypothetical protein